MNQVMECPVIGCTETASEVLESVFVSEWYPVAYVCESHAAAIKADPRNWTMRVSAEPMVIFQGDEP